MAKFQADPHALTAAAKVFEKEVEPISKAKTKAAAVTMDTASGGQYGTWAHQYAVTYKQMVSALLLSMENKTNWAGDNLRATADDYTKRDSGNAAGLKHAGKGA